MALHSGPSTLFCMSLIFQNLLIAKNFASNIYNYIYISMTYLCYFLHKALIPVYSAHGA